MSLPHDAVLALAVPLAWGLDARFGEPRDAWHPVAWLGRLLAPLGAWLNARRPAVAFTGGALSWCVLALAVGVAAAWLQGRLLALDPWWAVPLLALALKPSFAWRMLRDEVVAVEAALTGPEPARGAGDRADAAGEPAPVPPANVVAARLRLARLVSRDVGSFGPDEIRETAIETLAENLNDSLVAPLFWFAVAGLPGALVYRLANTLDAMWGYRGAWEWAGKWAARADDVLSAPPALLTAALLRPGEWRRLRREACRTPSPNGGWPMGAMALRLGTRLRKPGVYALNAEARSPGAADVAAAIGAAEHAARLAFALAALACLCRVVHQ